MTDTTPIVPPKRKENYAARERMMAVRGKYREGMMRSDDVSLAAPASMMDDHCAALAPNCGNSCGGCASPQSLYSTTLTAPMADYHGINCYSAPLYPRRVPTRLAQETSAPEFCPTSTMQISNRPAGYGGPAGNMHTNPKLFKLQRNAYSWGQGRCSQYSNCGRCASCAAQPGFSGGYNVAYGAQCNTMDDYMYDKAEANTKGSVYTKPFYRSAANENFTNSKWQMSIE